MGQLQLSLFGSFTARYDGTSLTTATADTTRGLLAYLAFHVDRPHQRTHLATLLWGPDAVSTSLTNLRSCLRRLRGALGDDQREQPMLLVSGETLQLNPQTELEVDAHTFTRLLNAVKTHTHAQLDACPLCINQLSQAVEHYH